MNEITLRIAGKNDGFKAQLIADIVNEVYQKSEGNIWVNEHRRTSKGQLINAIRSKEIILALKDDEFYGCIHLEKISDDAFRFKMLVANPNNKRVGVGSKLVSFAENEAKRQGASVMQLELLVPTEFEHEDKVFLTNWYTRIGYKYIDEHDVDYVHNGISKFLKTGCVAKVYEKRLD